MKIEMVTYSERVGMTASVKGLYFPYPTMQDKVILHGEGRTLISASGGH